MISRFTQVFQEYSDAYKDYHGVRPLIWNVSSIEEMEKQTQLYYDWIAEDLAQERANEDASINACMEAGAPDIDTAMRWLEQANIHVEWV